MIPRTTVPVEPFGEGITALAFAPDGGLAVATEAGGIFLVSVAGEKQPLRDATQAKVRCLAWRNQGEPLLAAGDENGNIAILKSGAAPRELANVPGGIQDLAWSPDGQSLAAACTDGTVRIWAISEAPDAEPPEVLAAHKGAALSVAWSADGSRLASGGNDGTVCIWRPSAAFGPMITHDKGAPLHSLAVSEDGTRIAAGSEQGDIFTWDAGNDTNSQSGTMEAAFSASRGSAGRKDSLPATSRVKSTSGTFGTRSRPVCETRRVGSRERSDDLARALVARRQKTSVVQPHRRRAGLGTG